MKRICCAISLLIVLFLTGTFGLPRVKRYTRGKDALPDEFPWQVLIQQGVEDWAVCGGAVLNENWVLTAGHCLRSSEGQKPLKYKLIFGEYNRKKQDGTEIYSDIAEIKLFPKYETVGHSYDIALAKLKTPLNFTDSKQKHIKPVCLALNPVNISGLTCVGSGFGRYSTYDMPAVLQKLEMKEFNLTACAKLHTDFHENERVIDTHVCMVSKENQYPLSGDSYGAACSGDSGGPLQCPINGTMYQVGVTWSNTDCEQNPSVYNRVDKYASWITTESGYTLPSRCNKA